MNAKTYEEIKQEALDALTACYGTPNDIGPDGYATATTHFALERAAREKVDAAIQEGIPARQLAHQTHLPGVLVIKLMSDPAERREAYEAELHRLQGAIRTVEVQRGWDIARRCAAGEAKVALAEEYGVSRPTLDAWIALAQH